MRTHSFPRMFLPRSLIAAAIGSALMLSPLTASAFEGELFSLKNRWEHTVTEMPANERESTLKALAGEAEQLAEQYSDEADVLVWLYDRAPGRPLGFGNSDSAERMFQRALEIRPDGIDVNYYYAAFLKEEGNEQAAREHAQRAVNGTARDNRQVSDEALRRDAEALLKQL